ADMPIHPKPCADTSRPCDPSLILGTSDISQDGDLKEGE
ncbi:hypothetical protein Tco_0947487, partial [Tanacetum coccineum]